MEKVFGEDLHLRADMDAKATLGLSHSAGLCRARQKQRTEFGIQHALERRELELAKCVASTDQQKCSLSQCLMTS